jgi:hypothetical protein
MEREMGANHSGERRKQRMKRSVRNALTQAQQSSKKASGAKKRAGRKKASAQS